MAEKVIKLFNITQKALDEGMDSYFYYLDVRKVNRDGTLDDDNVIRIRPFSEGDIDGIQIYGKPKLIDWYVESFVRNGYLERVE